MHFCTLKFIQIIFQEAFKGSVKYCEHSKPFIGSTKSHMKYLSQTLNKNDLSNEITYFSKEYFQTDFIL